MRKGRTDSAPMVSVVLPVYNGERYLAETVESVRGQTYPSWELFIVDDGSTDRSGRIADDLAAADPARIRVLRHPGRANRGVSAARNLAIREARGPFIAFLDADDIWRPRKLAVQAAYMKRFPEVGITFTRAQIQRTGKGEKFMPGIDVVGHKPTRNKNLNVLQILTIQINYIFSTVMVRSDAIRSVGGFIENLPFQSEDRIMVALVSAEYCIRRIPLVLAYYRAHDDSYSAGVVARRTTTSILLDLQVRVIRRLLRSGNRHFAIDLSARLLPGGFFYAIPRLRRKTIGIFFRDIGILLHALPHWPLIVTLHYLSKGLHGLRNIMSFSSHKAVLGD